MKKTIFSLILFFASNMVFAQEKALTENGKEVLLFEDGTWEYSDTSYRSKQGLPKNKISQNPSKFIKPKESSFLLKSKKINVGFWINSEKWRFSKAKRNPAAEYEFQLKGEDLYAMAVTEKISIPLETLKMAALQNAKAAAPDIKLIKEEYRTVNNVKVLVLQMNGTVHGIPISYYGYYFSNPKGSVQFLAYTSQSLLKQYQTEIEKFLNGFVEFSAKNNI